MYVKRDKEKLKQAHFTCLEDLVPEKHLLREIEVNAYRSAHDKKPLKNVKVK